MAIGTLLAQSILHLATRSTTSGIRRKSMFDADDCVWSLADKFVWGKGPCKNLDANTQYSDRAAGPKLFWARVCPEATNLTRSRNLISKTYRLGFVCPHFCAPTHWVECGTSPFSVVRPVVESAKSVPLPCASGKSCHIFMSMPGMISSGKCIGYAASHFANQF